MSDRPEHSLEQLLARTALRDRQAFEQLYQSTSMKLFSVVRRILQQDTLAEESLQEIYLKIWRNAGDYHAGRGRPMTWLISLARNQAIDKLRALGRRPDTQGDELPDVLDETAPGPAQLTANAALADDLTECLGRLPEASAVCVQLAYCEGYTHQELSERTGKPVGTVKSWLRRGLSVLRDCLQAMHGEGQHG